mgnify:CR=1 FL=1
MNIGDTAKKLAVSLGDELSNGDIQAAHRKQLSIDSRDFTYCAQD